MSRFRASPLWIVVLLAAFWLPPAARAQSLEPPEPRMMDPIGGPSYWQGSADHLPSLPGVTERQILDHALTMPAVQALLEEAARRGYVRYPEHDRAVIQSEPRLVGALLSLEKPGFSPPPGTQGAPLIQVISTDVYGNPRTSSSLYFVLVDEASHAVRTADDEPSMLEDGALEIHDGYAGGGGGSVRLHPTLKIPPRLKYCGTRFGVCSFTRNAACVVMSLTPGPYPWQVRVISLAVCSILQTGYCLEQFVDCMYQQKP